MIYFRQKYATQFEKTCIHKHTHESWARLRQKLFAFKCAELSLLVLLPLLKLWDQRGLVSATAAANDISYAHLHCSESLLTPRESKLKKRESESAALPTLLLLLMRLLLLL